MYTKYPELEEILSAVNELDSLDAQRRAAFEQAVGTYADDGLTPSVQALVWQGKVGLLQIADPVCKLDPKDAEALINGVVINAYVVWYADFLRLSGVPVSDVESG